MEKGDTVLYEGDEWTVINALDYGLVYIERGDELLAVTCKNVDIV